MSKSVKDLLYGITIKEITGNLIFSDKENWKIVSLEGLPQKIGGHVQISGTDVESLVGCPQVINGDFRCNFNSKLISLDGMPKEVDDFICQNNHKLEKKLRTKHALKQYIQENCKVKGRIFV